MFMNKTKGVHDTANFEKKLFELSCAVNSAVN